VTYVVTLKCVPKVDIVGVGFGFQLTGSCNDDVEKQAIAQCNEQE
jgi:hypothetical protein